MFRKNHYCFFILELPSNENDEKNLRKKETDPMHKDIYYIDGLNSNEALLLLMRYGNLLINDGLSRFGFGAQDNTAEIMIGKYNVVTLWSNLIEKFDGFFETHNIKRTDNTKSFREYSKFKRRANT